MVQSLEYPDLKWTPPKSWTNDVRTSVQLIVIHTTEGSEGRTSAEDGAAYDSRRTDGTSAHYFHDQDSTVQCVLTKHIAHTAFYEGNRRGIQHELCARAGQTVTQWADVASEGTLRQAAKQCARDAKKWNIPVRKLTTAQVKAGQKGFCGHVEITGAFAGNHTDPGKNFPWTKFLGMVNQYMSGDDDMQLTDIVHLPQNSDVQYSNPTTTVEGILGSTNYYVLQTRNKTLDGQAKILAGQAAILAAIRGDDTPEILAAINVVGAKVEQVDEAVMDKLVNSPVDELAELLKQLPAERLAELKAKL